MPTVTSENREEFNNAEMEKRSQLKEKRKPSASNDFYSKYKDKLTPNKDYFEFVKGNELHIREHAGNISKKIKTFTGLNEKQQAKKHHEHMSEMRNHVTEAWDYTKPTN
jgi:hypothetical protein